jgi:tRNA A37 threonylcarbamoyladenosine dehydratase
VSVKSSEPLAGNFLPALEVLTLFLQTMVKPSDKIVIIGCGCFGASTAYHLLQRGFTDVTIIDKSDVLPAPDAASNDINRSK